MEYIKLKGLNIFDKIKLLITGETKKEYYNRDEKLVKEFYDRNGLKKVEFYESYNKDGFDFVKSTERNYSSNSNLINEKIIIDRIIPEKGLNVEGIVEDQIIIEKHFKNDKYIGYTKESYFENEKIQLEISEVRLEEKNYSIERKLDLEKNEKNFKYRKIEFLNSKIKSEIKEITEKIFTKMENFEKLENSKETISIKNYNTNERELVTFYKDENEKIIGIENNDRNLKIETLLNGKIRLTEFLKNGNIRTEIYPENYDFQKKLSGTNVDIKEVDSNGNVILEAKNVFKFNFFEPIFEKTKEKLEISKTLDEISEISNEIKNDAKGLILEFSKNKLEVKSVNEISNEKFEFSKNEFEKNIEKMEIFENDNYEYVDYSKENIY